MFSAEQYRALREGAGLVTRADRGVLRFTGADRATFLQGVLTNDIAALTAGSGCYAALLTPNGRMISDMRVFELGDAILMEVDAQDAAALRARFDQMIFSEEVQVENVSEALRELGIYGPRATEVVRQVKGADALADDLPVHASRRVELAGGGAVIVRSQEAGVDGVDAFVPAAEVEVLASRLRAAGAIDVGLGTAEVTRIEAGHPRFHVDMDEETIPLEAGIEDRAISLTKGCYVGQEIIIRVLHRGGGRVARRLVGLTLDAESPIPSRGETIYAGDRQVGLVTSAARSPALGRPIALGYVHRDFVEPGTAVTVATVGGPVAAAVTTLPFVPALTVSAS